MVDPDIEAAGRLVVEAREKRGWTAIDFSKEMGLFHYPLARLEAGEEWPDDDYCRAIEEALGWYPGSLVQLRELAEFMDLERFTLPALEMQPQGTDEHQQAIREARLRSEEEAHPDDPWRMPK